MAQNYIMTAFSQGVEAGSKIREGIASKAITEAMAAIEAADAHDATTAMAASPLTSQYADIAPTTPDEGAITGGDGDDHLHGSSGADVGVDNIRSTFDRSGMSPDALAAFGRLEETAGEAFEVNSAYRDPAHNEAVGGARGSQHMGGNAFDIDVSGKSIEERQRLIVLARQAGFAGVGVYNNALHFDTGPQRAWGPSYSADSVPQWAAGALATPVGGAGLDQPAAGGPQRAVPPGRPQARPDQMGQLRDLMASGAAQNLPGFEAAAALAAPEVGPVQNTPFATAIPDAYGSWEMSGGLLQSESSGNYGASNNVAGAGGTGHFGRGQFSRARIQDAVNAGVLPAQFAENPQALLQDPQSQQRLEQWHAQDIQRFVVGRGLDRYLGQEVGGAVMTPQSMLAIAHLGGKGGLESFLTSGGHNNPSDAFGTSLQDYGQRFGAIV